MAFVTLDLLLLVIFVSLNPEPGSGLAQQQRAVKA